jgi:hypothetical protein
MFIGPARHLEPDAMGSEVQQLLLSLILGLSEVQQLLLSLLLGLSPNDKIQ